MEYVSKASMTNPSILIVEDEKIIANDIRFSLLRIWPNANINTSNSAENALQKIEKSHPDIVIMDIHLQGDMDGIEAAGIIRENFDVPVVYLTSFSDHQILERAKLTEPFGYLLKPFDERTLSASIEMAVFKHRIENMLKQSEEKYRQLAENTLDGIFIHEESSGFTYVNPALEHILGYKSRYLCSRRFKMTEHFLNGKGLSSGDKTRSVQFRSRTGQLKHLEIRTVRLGPDNRKQLGMVRDITDRIHAENKLHESQNKLKNLSIHLQQTREEERTHIAREIHDELGQTLTALKMDISWLADRLSDNSRKELLEKTDSSLSLINDLIHSVKRIATSLRPGSLDHLGLVSAIKWQTGEFEQRTGIRCFLDSPTDPPPLSKDLSTGVFRIFQQVITNIARHSSADKAWITLQIDDSCLRLRIRDNGIGISHEQIAHPQSYGIIGMNEYAEFLGGTVTFSGEKNSGTTVTVDIPLTKEISND